MSKKLGKFFRIFTTPKMKKRKIETPTGLLHQFISTSPVWYVAHPHPDKQPIWVKAESIESTRHLSIPGYDPISKNLCSNEEREDRSHVTKNDLQQFEKIFNDLRICTRCGLHKRIRNHCILECCRPDCAKPAKQFWGEVS